MKVAVCVCPALASGTKSAGKPVQRPVVRRAGADVLQHDAHLARVHDDGRRHEAVGVGGLDRHLLHAVDDGGAWRCRTAGGG